MEVTFPPLSHLDCITFATFKALYTHTKKKRERERELEGREKY